MKFWIKSFLLGVFLSLPACSNFSVERSMTEVVTVQGERYRCEYSHGERFNCVKIEEVN